MHASGDLINPIQKDISIRAGAVGDQATPTAVDCINHAGNMVTGILVIGTLTGSPTTLAVAGGLYESETEGGTYTAVSGATLTIAASIPADVQNIVHEVKGLRSKRWVRWQTDETWVGGTSPTAPMCGLILGQKAQY